MNFHNLNIITVHKERSKGNSNTEDERHMLDLDFGDTPEKLKGEYLDVSEGIQSDILSTTRFDENLDLSTTYLGRVDLFKNSKIKAGVIPNIRTRVHNGKIVRRNRVPSTVRYRSH